MKTFALILLVSMPSMAGTVVFDSQEITYDDDWSLRQRPNQYSDIPDGTVVYASDFSQEATATPSFNPEMTGVHFYNCDLCGTVIPPGNFVHDFFHNSGCSE